MSKRVASEISEETSNLSNAAAKLSRACNGTNAHLKSSSNGDAPVVVIHDYVDDDNQNCKMIKGGRQQKDQKYKVFDPESSNLFDDIMYPLSRKDFLKNHFRKNAVHIQRRKLPPQSKKASGNAKDIDEDYKGNNDLVSLICDKYLFDLDVRQIFAETSSENVFLWLRPPSNSSPTTLNSVEISDPDTAYALHQSGSHPAYCRAPPTLEQLLVGSLLRSTGVGSGHYHPPHSETVTLGGGTTLGRGEVELFIGAKDSDSKPVNGNSSTKKHTTGAHTDFQENFTIQLSGVKQWTLRRGRVRHPLRATTPHYCREPTVVENQLKVARLCCLAGDDAAPDLSNYGFEYNDNNAYGAEQTITLYPGDVFYFPSGMWHTVKTIEPGVSLNVSLMGTTYATLVCDALQHLLVGSDERWREIVTSRPGDVNGADRLQELLKDLSKTVDEFVEQGGGAQSILPPALCYPHVQSGSTDNQDELGSNNGENGNESLEEDGSMMEITEELYEEENGQATTELVVNVDTFEGPSGWSCKKPHGSKLIKNPLALLIAKEEITAHISSDASEEVESDAESSTTKHFILNVNYAGNEMFESHIRVTLETETYADLLADISRGAIIGNDQTPPDCLFYYGLFSWAA